MNGWSHCHDFGGLAGQLSPRCSVIMQSSASSSEETSTRFCHIENSKVAGGQLLIKLAAVEDRNTANAYCGQYVLMPRKELKNVEEGEFYQCDLLGLPVYQLDGLLLGCVTSFIESPAHWIFVVTTQNQKITAVEHLIPFVASHVVEVDLPNARIVVENV